MVPFQVIVLEEHLPTSLSSGQTLQFLKVGEVFVVGKDGDRVGGSSEELVPLQEGMYDGEELVVVNVIVSFSKGKGF